MTARNGANGDGVEARFKRYFIAGVLGGALGGAAGTYVSDIRGSQLYIPIGVILGIILGEVLFTAFAKRLSSDSIDRLGRGIVYVMTALGFGFAGVGIIAFALGRQFGALVAALLCAAAGVFFLIRAIRGGGLP